MSSSSTKETITKYYDGVKKKNGWESVISDDMLFTMGTQTTKGKPSYVEITSRFLRAVTDSNVKEVIVEGNKACVLVAYDLRSPKGNTSTKDVVEILKVDSGKIVASSIYFDTEDFRKFMAD
jgi:ketosteroid isomerase-like protein